MRIAVIGTGYWGTKVADTVEKKYDVLRLDVNDNIQSAKYDAAIICTPAEYHYGIASTLLRKSIPVLVEKPVAINLHEVVDLCDIAQEYNTVIQAFVQTKDSRGACSWFDKLCDANLQPTEISFNMILNVFARNGDPARAISVLDKMVVFCDDKRARPMLLFNHQHRVSTDDDHVDFTSTPLRIWNSN